MILKAILITVELIYGAVKTYVPTILKNASYIDSKFSVPDC